MPPAANKLWKVRVTEDKSAGRSFWLQEGSVSLGASPDCEIVSSATGVAPRHAEFFLNAGALQLRILDGAPPFHLNGAPVRGTVDVPCPSTIEFGALRVFITQSGSTAASQENSDSTIRGVRPASPGSPQFADHEGLDVTGRIVYQLPGAAGASPAQPALNAPDLESENTSASFSGENTMAFSMEPPDLQIMDKLAVRVDYEVKGEIARGGMGKIYSAADSELDRLVALKVNTAADRGGDSQFFREAKVLAALAHPNIVPVHNLGVDAEGRPFYSMKLIQGRTLQWILKQLAAGDRSIALVYTRDRLLEIFRKVCDAVSFAHSKGYLHRDLKPENIMVGEFGEVLVMDWGLAKAIRKTGPESGQTAVVDAEPETLSYIEGTPQYMSPEQANGIYGGLDERSDIYSLGGVLYAILTYRPPVSGASAAEVIQKVRLGETTTMAMPRRGVAGADPARIEQAVPEALRAVTLKALAREKTRRYQSVFALVADIKAYQSGFATSAEDASLLRQVWLLAKRHRMAATLMFLFACGSVVFTVQLAESERTALANSDRADKERQHAENEARSAAEQKLLAEKNARRAESEKQAARKALAQMQLTVAEASEQRFNAEEMDTALRQVDPEFRTHEWEYLNSALHSEQRTYTTEAGFIWRDCVPHPEKPGVMIALQSGRGYNVLRILNLDTGDFDKPFKESFKIDGDIEPASLAVSRDASLVAVLERLPSKTGVKAETHQIVVWNLAKREKTKLTETSFSGRALLEFSPDGRKLMKVCMGAKSGDQDAGLSMFDVQTGKKLWQLRCDSPYDAEFDPNSGRVYYVSSTESLELNPGDGLQSSRPSIPLQGTLSRMPVLMKGLHVFQTFGPSLRHYVIGKAHFEVKLPGNLIGRMNLAVTTRDNCVAALAQVGDNSAVLQVRELDYGNVVQTVPILIDGPRRAEWRLAAHPDSGHYAVFRATTMKVWNITRYSEKTRLGNFWSNATGWGFAFLNSPDEILQVSPPTETSDNAQLFSVDVRQIKESESEIKRGVDKVSLPKSFGPHFSASKDGRTIAALSLVEKKSLLTTYRVQSDGTIVQQPPALPVVVSQMRISPDGEKILTVSGVLGTRSGEWIQKHERSGTGKLTYENAGQWCWTDNVHMVEIAFVSALGELGVDRSLVLWSSEHSTPLIPPVPAPNATALSSSPDGTTVAEGGKDGKVRLRDPRTLEVLEHKTFRVHDGPVTGVAWHPRLPLLATASEDRRVRILSVETGRLVEEFGFFSMQPQQLDWSPDGRNLAIRHAHASCFLKPASCQVQ